MPDRTASAMTASTAALTTTSIRANPASERGLRIGTFIDRSAARVEPSGRTWGADPRLASPAVARGVRRGEAVAVPGRAAGADDAAVGQALDGELRTGR